MSDKELRELKEEIEFMTPPAQLRLAAELIERGNLILAEAIARRVADECTLIIRLRG